jgi:hypothetical protein
VPFGGVKDAPDNDETSDWLDMDAGDDDFDFTPIFISNMEFSIKKLDDFYGFLSAVVHPVPDLLF